MSKPEFYVTSTELFAGIFLSYILAIALNVHCILYSLNIKNLFIFLSLVKIFFHLIPIAMHAL